MISEKAKLARKLNLFIDALMSPKTHMYIFWSQIYDLHERDKLASKLNLFTDASILYGPRVTTVRKTLVGKDTKPIYS